MDNLVQHAAKAPLIRKPRRTTSWLFALIPLFLAAAITLGDLKGTISFTPVFIGVAGTFALYGMSRIWRALEAMTGTRDD